MKVSIASDHRGVHIKARIIQALESNGHIVFDEGADCDDASDYPDFASVVAQKVSQGDVDRGILICGTGIGMAITANKFSGVRAAPCYDEVMVELSRRHNDLNVLCLGGDLIGDRNIDDLILLWMRTEFEGGRHARRVDKIVSIETKNAV
ncbi:Putative sugar phosphate isomerase YwlF [Rosistilla ulvae]|uniref:Sugar phosphate isomerase YwlF n=1 Tax=Rosistilla ulvae TaxID=1930277 RepID=A0A517M670_9BACT|nr:ribose 5-phosphate isomerase B [Rosistilla ulvae]QDS90365.1 Putative sugar phosphate isomerase YwlF [Rosistilla ulvae]